MRTMFVQKRFFFPLVICFILTSSIFMHTSSAEIDDDAASSAITSAEMTLVSAYQAVVESEQVGANVSGLLIQLNEAGEFLTKARIKYKLGNHDQAVSLADMCSEISKKVESETAELRNEAFVLWVTAVGLATTESSVLVVAVVLGSFWSWRAFKRRYYKRILKMKPEIASHES